MLTRARMYVYIYTFRSVIKLVFFLYIVPIRMVFVIFPMQILRINQKQSVKKPRS